MDFVIAKRLHSCCSKEEINTVTFEELDDEGHGAVNIAWSGDKQPVRNDKHFASLDLLNISREEFGRCIGAITEGYWMRDPT